MHGVILWIFLWRLELRYMEVRRTKFNTDGRMNYEMPMVEMGQYSQYYDTYIMIHNAAILTKLLLIQCITVYQSLQNLSNACMKGLKTFLGK